MLDMIISGGQTGVDRAALDVAMALGIRVAGWCPLGRKAEDGQIAEHYPLTETDSANYEKRTKANVRDSDATLVLNAGPLEGGTLATVQHAQKLGKPYLVAQIDDQQDLALIRTWLSENAIRVLNVAGPRESKRPGIYHTSTQILASLFHADRRSDPALGVE